MLTASKIWVPDSHSDKQIISLSRAAREYDERLFFGRNEDNGQWAVFMKMEHGQDPVPVLGFGFELPTGEELVAKLWQYDTRRHGDRILDRMNQHNEQRKRELEAAADEATDIFVEGQESYLHRQGQTPYHRSLRKRDPKHRFFEKGQ